MFDARHSLSTCAWPRRSAGLVTLVLLTTMIWGLGIAGVGTAHAGQTWATLTAGTGSSMAGTNVDLIVSFAPGSSAVSTLQFDLLLPPSLSYVAVGTGAAAAAAQKTAFSSLSSAGVHVVLFGMNNTVIGSGPVAVVTLLIAPGTPASSIPVVLQNVVASNPAATAVAVSGVNGSVSVLPRPDTTPPVISDIVISMISSSGATLGWTTDEASDSQVEYGTTAAYGSATALDAAPVIRHTQFLSGLKPGTVYHYRVISKDASGNTAVSADGVFATSPPPDATPPVISGIVVSGVTSTGASISWTTNEAANSQIQFGTTTSYGSSTILDPALVTAHSQTVSGLAANTTYHCQVKSADASGNLATSANVTFTTASDSKPPAISRVTVSRTNMSGASISWYTDVPADSQLVYGTTSDCTLSTRLNTNLVTGHSQSLNNLNANTVYYYRAQSKSAAGLLAQSAVLTFKTAPAKKTKGASAQYVNSAAAGSDGDSGGEQGIAEYKGVVVTNTGDTPAELTFIAHPHPGAETSPSDKAQRTLPPGKQLVLMDFELFGDWVREPGSLDWIEIESSSHAVTGFTMVFDADLSRLDHTQLMPAALTDFLFAEIGNRDSTSLHISNPNAGAAQLTFRLIQSDGQLRAAVQRRLDAGSTMTEYLDSLFPETAVAASDYLRVASDVGVIPVERFGAKSQDTASLSGLDVNGGSDVLYCLQYAAGVGYRSNLSVTNLESRDGRLELRLYGDDGAQIGQTKDMPITAHGKVEIDDPFFFGVSEGGPTVGYVRISGGGLRIAGHVVFGDADSGTTLAALPLTDQVHDALVISHIASNPVSFTQLALLNPNDSDVSVTVNLYQAGGMMEASTRVTIAAGQRIMQRLTQLFPQLSGQDRTSGYLEVLADRGVVGFSLLGTHDFKALDAVRAQPVQGRQKQQR